MLCFARKSNPQKQRLELGSLVEETVQLMRPLLDQRSIELVSDCDEAVEIDFDPEMLRQITTNLITNSVRALPGGGLLAVGVSAEGGMAKLTVRDNGVGIPDHVQPSVFESGFTTSREGNGLGLSIVQRLVEAHGGCVSLESQEGIGTQVVLTFPMEKREHD
jgi:signal transduction histidine kinase